MIIIHNEKIPLYAGGILLSDIIWNEKKEW